MMHAGRHYAAEVEEELVEKNSRGIDFISRFSTLKLLVGTQSGQITFFR